MPAPLTALACLLAFLPAIAAAQQDDGTDVAVTAHVFKPAKVEASAARIVALKVPKGLTIRPVTEGLKDVRILAVSPQGWVYVSRREQGNVLMFEDADRDGDARRPRHARTVRQGTGAGGGPGEATRLTVFGRRGAALPQYGSAKAASGAMIWLMF